GEGVFFIIINFLHGMQCYTPCKFATSASCVKLCISKKLNGCDHCREFFTRSSKLRVREAAALSSFSPAADSSKYCADSCPASSSNSQNPSVTHFLFSACVSYVTTLSSPASGSVSVKSAWHPVVGYTNTAVVPAKEMTPFHAFSGPALNSPAKVPTNPPSSLLTGDAESTSTTPRSTIGVGSG